MRANNGASGSLKRLRPLFETALDAAVAMRLDGTVAEWNVVAERTFGWSREEAHGKLLADLIVPQQHREAHIRGIQRYNETGEGPVLDRRIEITALDRQGREFPVELSITATFEAGERLFVGFLRDISDRKRAEQLLVRQAREANLLFRISRFAAESDAVEPVLEETLRAICELTGWPVGHALVAREGPERELVSTGIWHGPEDESSRRLREVTARTRFTPGVGLPGVILQTGEPTWMSDTENEANFVRKGLGFGAGFGFPLTSSGNVIAALEFFTRDKLSPDAELLLTVRTLGEQVGRVLERRSSVAALRSLNETLEQRVVQRTLELEQAHEALRQAQKMEAIGQLTGGIAHDFNNLLTVIKGSTGLLRRPDLSEEKRRRYVDAISDTADRAAKLTGQLLAFARRQALSPEVFDAAARIQGIGDMLRTILGSRIRLVMDAECRDCFIEADAAQFETALVNLAVNARDAMDGEGKLTVSVGVREDCEAGEMVAVTVTDTGHGISPEQLERVFEPFFTTKQPGKGTGLGLSQVYGFVKQSNGDVQVETKEGAGASFILTFPRVNGAEASDGASATVADRPVQGTRVLVVEDNADVGGFASQLLHDLGFEATLAADASLALEELMKRRDRYDIVFSDVVMPGIDGIEFAKKVRERWPELPVVLTTGYSHVMAEDPGHGFPILQKPYSADGLSRILGKARSTSPRLM